MDTFPTSQQAYSQSAVNDLKIVKTNYEIQKQKDNFYFEQYKQKVLLAITQAISEGKYSALLPDCDDGIILDMMYRYLRSKGYRIYEGPTNTSIHWKK